MAYLRPSGVLPRPHFALLGLGCFRNGWAPPPDSRLLPFQPGPALGQETPPQVWLSPPSIFEGDVSSLVTSEISYFRARGQPVPDRTQPPHARSPHTDRGDDRSREEKRAAYVPLGRAQVPAVDDRVHPFAHRLGDLLERTEQA